MKKTHKNKLNTSFGACSVMMKTNSQGTFVGRTTDFFGPLQTKLEIVPRNIKQEDPFTRYKWQVKYGSVGIYDFKFWLAGINEKGLNAHILLLEDSSEFPDSLPDKPTISTSWVKYVLTNCGSVKEMIANLPSYQLKVDEVVYQGKVIPGMMPHMAVFDTSGDAAIIECVNKKMLVYHGPQYNVLTNAPKLNEQITNLKKLKKEKKWYSLAQLPGGADSKNRFVRATFNMENMSEPKSSIQAIAYMQAAVNNITVPAYDDKKHPFSPLSDAWQTHWRVIYDLKELKMYFEQDSIGKKVYLKLKNINFDAEKVKHITLTDIKSDYEL